MILLDTNVISEPMRHHPEGRVISWLDAQAPETLFLSTVSLSEILLGIESLLLGKRRKALAAALEHLLSLFHERILPFDVGAAEVYPRIVLRARHQGHPIAVGDAQIAAIAALRQFSVATRDEAPFRAAGLPVINPWTAVLEPEPHCER